MLQNFIFNKPVFELSKLRYANKKNLTALFKSEKIDNDLISKLAHEIQVYKCPEQNVKAKCSCGLKFQYKKSIYKHRKKCEIYKHSIQT